MSKSVKVKCRYYQVRELVDGEVTENILDLRTWIATVPQTELEHRCKEDNAVKGRVEEVVRFGDSEVYAMNFMRMDEVSTSYILKESDPAEHIDLEEGEYIAKNTVCLYDADEGIIMIQCNRGGYSDKAIQSYINMFLDHNKCCLLPIMEEVNFTRNGAEYLKLDVRLANFKEFEPTPGSSFEKILQGMNQLDGVNAHVELSLGTQKNARLNAPEVRKTIADLSNNRGCVSSAKIKLSDEQVSGVYDLFDNLCEENIVCTINPQGGIAFRDLANNMNNRYVLSGAKERVLRALRM